MADREYREQLRQRGERRTAFCLSIFERKEDLLARRTAWYHDTMQQRTCRLEETMTTARRRRDLLSATRHAGEEERR
jgi:hypothetical protein